MVLLLIAFLFGEKRAGAESRHPKVSASCFFSPSRGTAGGGPGLALSQVPANWCQKELLTRLLLQVHLRPGRRGGHVLMGFEKETCQ